MKKEKDTMGKAIADFFKGRRDGKLRVLSPMFEEDEIPLTTLFRSFRDMPKIEQKALKMAKGKVLDVGAGSGCHALWLQDKGMDVTAIDISPYSIETMKERGVVNVREQDFFTLEEKYDTILMLMNGIGIVGTLDKLPEFFKHIDNILAEDGQLLCDSSDLCYLYDDKDGIVELMNSDKYYGELEYTMCYDEMEGDSFPWLYIDANTLRTYAETCGFKMEIVRRGEHYDYLARISRIRN
ncbi:MAG: methyltransferase domain-containing protein [Bacteroidales bacterium]|nr:methyltransferase domain-containing protein [Bacteroidales bacterium]